jgi:hypothetical protein
MRTPPEDDHRHVDPEVPRQAPLPTLAPEVGKREDAVGRAPDGVVDLGPMGKRVHND